jgi:NAD+ kinase
VRRVLLVTHTGRAAAREAAARVIRRLSAEGVEVVGVSDELDDTAGLRQVAGPDAARGCELVLVLGGDGSLLRGAELARDADVPLIGVNLGHVGFLAEAEPGDLDETITQLLEGNYAVEERMTLDVAVTSGGQQVQGGWALNDAVVAKADRSRMLDCVVAVDDRPVSQYGCDAVVCATPTGSTAYAFSGGGPILWPDVEALLVVPIGAHALFARPLVTAPSSVITVDVLPRRDEPARVRLWCDGRRLVDPPAGPASPPVRAAVRRSSGRQVRPAGRGLAGDRHHGG